MTARGCWYWLGCVFAFVVVATTARAEDAGAQADGCAPQGGSAVAVTEAVDGDTLRLADGRMVHVAGIEAVKPAGSAGTAGLAEAARSEVARLTGGQAVTLFMRGQKADRYGRFHADVALPDGTSLGVALVRAGLARVRLFPGENACVADLLAAERAARAAGIGLWSNPEFAIRRADDPSLPARSGLYALVEGRVTSVGHGRVMIFLDFGRDYRRDFTIMVPASLAGRLAMPADDFKGRRIRVRGVIEESGGPAIRLADPAEIEVLDGDRGAGGQG